MSQGRRSMRRGGKKGRRREPDLRKDIESCGIEHPTVDQLVDILRSKYPFSSRSYVRGTLGSLRRKVQKTLRFINSNIKERKGGATTIVENRPKKRMKRIDSEEEKVQQLGAQHLKKRRTSQDSSRSSGTSRSSSLSFSHDDDGLLTSEDRVYSEEVDPTVLELEVVNDNGSKGKKEVDLLREGNQRRPKVELDRGKSEGGGSTANVPTRFKDLGGMTGVINDLIKRVLLPLYQPQLPRHPGERSISGILFHGPPGCGKTSLAQAIANETRVPFYKVSATDLVSGISGASEENIRELFARAYRTAPSIIFIDEIDAIASRRENLQREMEKRMVTQLMTCMDDSNRRLQPADGSANTQNSNGRPGYVLVIGATNRPDAIDPALRRPGRFDREIFLEVPDENGRVNILSKLTHDIKVEGDLDLVKIARSTPGFVGADLDALRNEACNLARWRMLEQRKTELSEQSAGAENAELLRQPLSPEGMEELTFTVADFEQAAKLVQPSSKREGFSAIPNVKWEDVGGLHTLRQEFDQDIVHRLKYPDIYADFGFDMETGILLYGPPGCGKTLIAKAVANEAGANFIHVKGPELLSKYVGESESAVRTIFSRARTCSPCIVFFDEMDALTTRRGEEGAWVVERLLNQLLIELDGADQRRGVFVIGATNRPEIVDPAILRPGRFGKLLYVPLPSPDERGLILKALGRKKPVDPNVDLMAIAKDCACENLSGADLAGLMNKAHMAAITEHVRLGDSSVGTPRTIKDVHFKRALEETTPSVSRKQRRHYELLSKRFKVASG